MDKFKTFELEISEAASRLGIDQELGIPDYIIALGIVEAFKAYKAYIEIIEEEVDA